MKETVISIANKSDSTKTVVSKPIDVVQMDGTSTKLDSIQVAHKKTLKRNLILLSLALNYI